ncbi:MAG: hypothetical protein WCD04_05035 [Terriglobia bacterium]|jgi:hypothetical protein
MNCKDFESMIHEIVSRRAPDKTKQLEALEHAGRCLWCALRLDEETKLTESLQAFARTFDVQRAPARVEEALVQAFRERTLREGAPRFGLAGKRLWRRLSWALAFATTVAAAWIVVLRTSRVHPSSSVPPPRAANTAIIPTRTPNPSQNNATEDPDKDLLQEVQADLEREVPEAVAPAVLIAEERNEILTNKDTQQTKTTLRKGEK